MDDNPRPDVGNTLCGVPIGQWSQDFFVWDTFFATHRDIAAGLEVGTLNGGMSIFFALQAKVYGFKFVSIDIHQRESDRFSDIFSRLHDLMAGTFRACDFWASGEGLIGELIGNSDGHPILVFCDGGDKSREYRTCIDLLRRGDYIVVHDWASHPTAEFAESHVDYERTELLMKDMCDSVHAHARFFRKR